MKESVRDDEAYERHDRQVAPIVDETSISANQRCDSMALSDFYDQMNTSIAFHDAVHAFRRTSPIRTILFIPFCDRYGPGLLLTRFYLDLAR